MKYNILAIAFTLLYVGSVRSLFFRSPEPLWNGLQTTFKPLSNGNPIPRTIAEAIEGASDDGTNGWFAASEDCLNNGLFNGLRYVQKINSTYVDTTVAALFNKEGVIVGIQMNIPVSTAVNNDYKFDEIPMFLRNTINGQEVFTLTAYFVDPSTICSDNGRTASSLTTEGTGTGLYFQNGTSPNQYFIAPPNRPDPRTTGWSNNNCFPGMGRHNWYEQEHFQDDDCSTVLPVFLLYNTRNKGIGFGFQHVGTTVAPRFEQPPAPVIVLIVGSKVSPCLLEKANTIGVTTMHVFLTSSPVTETCIPNPLV